MTAVERASLEFFVPINPLVLKEETQSKKEKRRYIRRILDERTEKLQTLCLDKMKMRYSARNLFDETIRESTISVCIFSIQFIRRNRLVVYNNVTHPWISVKKESTPEAFLRSFAHSILSDEDLERFSPSVLLVAPDDRKKPYIKADVGSRLSSVYASTFETLYPSSEKLPENSMPYHRRFYVLSLEDRERNQFLEFFAYLGPLSRRSILRTFVKVEGPFYDAMQDFVSGLEKADNFCVSEEIMSEQQIESEDPTPSASEIQPSTPHFSDTTALSEFMVDLSDSLDRNAEQTENQSVEMLVRFYESDDENNHEEAFLRRRMPHSSTPSTSSRRELFQPRSFLNDWNDRRHSFVMLSDHSNNNSSTPSCSTPVEAFWSQLH